MISKKRIVLSSMAAALALSLAGCGSSGGSSSGTPAADTTAPVITLSGASTITLTVGDTYTEAGATANDNVDGNVAVTTTGSVDTTTAGTYTITYTAKDAANNTATLTRTVVVQAAAPAASSSYIPYPIRTQAQIDAATVLSGDITSNMTLSASTLYKIDGLVKVKNGATLTIPAGTVLFGDTTGDDYIVVTKGAKIMAEGTATNPIVFTSQIALLDPANADVAQWGGLTVLGDAPTNQTNPFYEVDQTDADFAFGGSNATDNSGVLRNVYILNSGKEINTNIEINGLSLAGVGSGTTVENIYVQNSFDDCIEIWGGTVNVTNATMVNCQDDGFDLDFGYTGTATNIVVQQTLPFFAGFEISSGGTTPMTSPKIVNFTINKVAGASEGGIYIKDDSTAPTFINGEVTTLDAADAGIHTKKLFTTDQKNAIAFKDVRVSATLKTDGAGATDADTRLTADDASITGLAYPTKTQAQIDAATVLSGSITADMTLDATKLYKIDGLVTVKNGATLTIPAGTVLFGDTTGDDFMVIAQGAKIIADGTATSPIVFTSETALLNPANADVAQWGGLTLLGKATTNSNNPFYEVDQTNPDFAFGGTAGDATYANDNSGILRNVYVLNSGKVIGTDIEINGLSLAGVGSGTTVENIYVQNSADDCIEIWGGTVNVTNATMINCQDDGFDLDFGYTGTATNIVVQQTLPFFAGFEISSGGTTPMTSPKIVNFTINKVASASEGGIYIKDDSTAPTFINGEVTTLDAADAGIHTKKLFTTDQKNAIAFKDVRVSATLKTDGAGATDADTRLTADDATFSY